MNRIRAEQQMLITTVIFSRNITLNALNNFLVEHEEDEVNMNKERQNQVTSPADVNTAREQRYNLSARELRDLFFQLKQKLFLNQAVKANNTCFPLPSPIVGY